MRIFIALQQKMIYFTDADASELFGGPVPEFDPFTEQEAQCLFANGDVYCRVPTGSQQCRSVWSEASER